MTMQALVMAHAAMGHNHFFKTTIYFKQWTDATSILDYLAFAKEYVAECEEKCGVETVEAKLCARADEPGDQPAPGPATDRECAARQGHQAARARRGDI